MRITYQGNRFTCLEVYSRKQRYCTKALILIITLYGAMAIIRQEILSGCCNGLDPGFFIIGKDVCCLTLKLDLCQYFRQKKLKDYAVFLVPHPPFAEVSYNQ